MDMRHSVRISVKLPQRKKYQQENYTLAPSQRKYTGGVETNSLDIN